jgi:drug/metabolite transporter (DMT)-like permease
MSGLSHGAKVWIALWTVYVIWGSTYLAIAVAVESLPPLLAVSSRFLVAGGVLAAFLAWRRRASLRISRRALAAAAVVGVLLPGAKALGLLVRDEELTPRILLGAAIVVASVAIVVRREAPAATPTEEAVR